MTRSNVQSFCILLGGLIFLGAGCTVGYPQDSVTEPYVTANGINVDVPQTKNLAPELSPATDLHERTGKDGDSKTNECVDFEYSAWSVCTQDGTRNRVVTKGLPAGCRDGNPAITESCTFVPGSTETALEIFQRILNQIAAAPGQSIHAEYIAGQTGELTQSLDFKIVGGHYVIHTVFKKTDTGEVAYPGGYYMDSDLDLFPDSWANEDGQFTPFDKNSDLYKQVTPMWAAYNAYFASYILNK